MPSLAPSPSPSPLPTTGPTFMSSFEPSFEPKTLRPTEKPTVEPSGTPTEEPTPGPSLTPSATPTRMPSVLPTNGFNSEPTPSPSLTPSANPTKMPSVLPTNTSSSGGMSTAQPTASNRSTPIETQSTSSSSAFWTRTLLALISVLFVGSVAIFCTIIVLVKITKRRLADQIQRKKTSSLGGVSRRISNVELSQVSAADYNAALYTNGGTSMGNANDRVSLAGESDEEDTKIDESNDESEHDKFTGEQSDPLANDFPLSSGSPSGNGRPTGGATNGRRVSEDEYYQQATDGDKGETREGIGSFPAAGYNIPD